MGRSAIVLLLTVRLLRGDENTQKLAFRLAEEASAFQQVAPQVTGVEKLEQRAPKPAGFRIRVGKAATRPRTQEWETRVLVSQYGFTAFADGSFHELREVTSVDGKPVKNRGAEGLARLILSSEEERKREMLRQFRDYGLRTGATDFGTLLALFTPANIVRFEFTLLRPDTLQSTPTLVFGYKQIDGPNGMTTIDENGKLQFLPLAGEIWVRADFLPMRITLVATEGVVRQEALVDYSLSRFGALLPTFVHHRELRAGQMAAEHTFTYSDFQPFKDSSK